MKTKRYLLVTLLAGAALLSGCSVLPDTFNSGNESETNNAAVTEDGLVNPSESHENIEKIPTATFEEGAVEVVTVPEVITSKPEYVPIELGEVSGSVVETEEEATVVFNKYDGVTIRQWVQTLVDNGWTMSTMETVDNETTFNTYLSKGEESILVYSNNLADNQNTLISFSK